MKNETFNDSRLDSLFQNARNQEPAYSFSETQVEFASSTLVAAGSVTGLKIMGSSFFKTKFFVMTITAIALISGVLLVNNSSTTIEKKTTNDVFKSENSREFVSKNKSQLNVANNFLDYSANSVKEVETPSTIGILLAKPTTIISSNSFIHKYFDNKFPFLNQRQVDEDTILFSYIITEKTTLEELDVIQKQACDAGIEMNYSFDIKRKIIRRLNIDLKLKENEKIFQHLHVGPMSFNKEFALEIAWRTDREGKVINLGNAIPSGAYVKIFKTNDKQVQRKKEKYKKRHSDSE